MVISNILGGLGNQMFQYAAARALSAAKGQPLYLDVSDFSGYRLHNGFELSRVFNFKFETAEARHLRHVLGWRSCRPLRRMLKLPQMAWLRGDHFVVEPHFHYWPGFFVVPDDCYLAGYWQSEKYFKSIEGIIRNEFSFNTPLAGMNAELANQIKGANAVSLHIRRGDYVQNARTLATHGVCSLDYYRTAIRYIAQRTEHPLFFLFSDDIAWVKDNLKIDFPCQHVDHNHGIESYNDMHLMSLCRHHIIANSSFSWWGAWLNSGADKIIVAPQKWFVNGKRVDDLFPQAWVTL